MSAAARSLALLSQVLALAACNETTQEGSVNAAAATEIEALPPDESVETPANEPANADAANY